MKEDRRPPDWKRLGDYVARRRVQLRLGSQQKLAEKAHVSISTINLIENAGRTAYQKRNLIALEDALDWAPGSIEAVLQGGEPTLVTTLPSGEKVYSTSPVSDHDLAVIAEKEDDDRPSFDDLRARLDAIAREAGSARAILDQILDSKS